MMGLVVMAVEGVRARDQRSAVALSSQGVQSEPEVSSTRDFRGLTPQRR
jgi:hypothetical protein